jgi:hypothetical protein
MALGFTHSVTEMSTGKLFWGVERDRRVRLTTPTPICEPIVWTIWDDQHLRTL